MRKIITTLREGKPRRGLQILDSRMGFPRPSLKVVLDSINPIDFWSQDHRLMSTFAPCKGMQCFVLNLFDFISVLHGNTQFHSSDMYCYYVSANLHT